MANQSIKVVAQPNSPVGSRLFMPIAEPGEPVVVIDPDVGDTIVVLPVIPLSHGVNNVFNYPDVRVLKTAQGVVVKPGWTISASATCDGGSRSPRPKPCIFPK